jgi:hypothetical protein
MLSPKLLLLAVSAAFSMAAPKPHAPVKAPANRVASFSISQDFLNEQLRAHVKSPLVQNLSVTLDPDTDRIYFRGIAQVPVEELRAINLEPDLGKFHFQIAARLAASKQGYLIVEFPLNETFFYPVGTRNGEREKVIVPVQMLSIALASARGYLAALSGDFGGFDRESKKLQGLKAVLDRAILKEKNADVKEDLKTQRESLRLKIEALPIERKQLQALSKEFSTVLSFTGEKELNLNEDLAAQRNAIMIKIKLSQLTPYLEGTQLGGVRIRHRDKDGGGQNYFVVDLNALLEGSVQHTPVKAPEGPRPGLATAPILIVRLNQALFESKAVLDREKSKLGSNIKNFQLELRDDGLHVTGSYKAFLFFSFPFETTIDIESNGPDVFEAKVREVKVGGNDFKFLAKYALESLENRLNESLKGICRFEYLGQQGDKSYALRITVDPQALVPAFPGLHLIDVDVREHEFLMKIGRP